MIVKISFSAWSNRPHFFLCNNAFTLLEILVALAILSIAMVTAVKNTGALISNTEYLKKKTLAHWVAMNKAAETKLSGRSGVWTESGDEKMADTAFHWEMDVERTEVDGINRAVIQVRAEKQEQQPYSVVTVYISQPQ